MLTSTYKKNLAAKVAMLGLTAAVACTLALVEPPTAQARELTADTPTIKLTTQAKKSIAKAKVSKVAAKTYTGKAIKPKPKVTLKGKKLKLNKDYKLTYKNNLHAGKATIKIKGIGKYTGTKSVKFTIDKVPIGDARVVLPKTITWYRGKLKDNPDLKKIKLTYKGQTLKEGKDYTAIELQYPRGGKYQGIIGEALGYIGDIGYWIYGIGDFAEVNTGRFTVSEPNCVGTTMHTINQGSGIVYDYNPTVLYVPKQSKRAKQFPYGIGGTEYVTSSPSQGTVVHNYVIDADPSKCETITMPKGLAEAWLDFAYTDILILDDGTVLSDKTTNRKYDDYDYCHVWRDFLIEAYNSPSSLKEYLNRYGFNCSNEFSEFLYRASRLGKCWEENNFEIDNYHVGIFNPKKVTIS